MQNRTVLAIAGLELEVLTQDAVPTGTTLDQARRETAAALAGSLGKFVSLRGRQAAGFLTGARVLKSYEPDERTARAFEQVADVLARRGAELRSRPGVLAVRPGYRFRSGWITNEPCIVVVVLKKLDDAKVPSGAQLPSTLDGVPIDVAPAGPVEQLLAAQAVTAPGTVTPELLANPMSLALPGLPVGVAPGAEAFTAELIRKSRYVPPPDGSLNPVQGPMNVLCHVSPDAGWPTLKPFLDGTNERLTIAMYDFTAPHIMRDLEGALARSGTMSLILDPGISLTAGGGGENPKAGDFQETDVEKDLVSKLGSRFAFTWAAVKREGKTSAGIFPTAYHIKVAVRDGKAFWLSSGNWQSSNQPDIDPLANEQDRNLPGLEQTFNREWHVVLDHAGLAETYEKFIKWDISQAQPLNVEPSALERPPLDVPNEFDIEAARPELQFFAPKTVKLDAADTVQPLLTPDNYADFALQVIQGAQQTLCLQNQYIKVSAKAEQNPPKFAALIDALRERIEAGVEVRIILRDIGNPRTMLEALQANGIDATRLVRLQKGCHNKGIIADGKVVLIGSHNWSGDGTVYNRDASLIFDNEDIAQYYQKIFDYDWETLAKSRTRAEDATPQLAVAAGPVPANTSRLPWNAYFGDDDQGDIDALLEAVAPLKSVPIYAQAAITGAPATPTPWLAQGSHSELRAAKAELSQRYLTSEKAVTMTAQAATASPVPEVNVVGVGIGEKFSEDMPTGELAVKLFVRLKIAKKNLSPDHLLPATIAGLPTDVQQVGLFEPRATMPNPRGQFTPAQPGCSIGFEFPAGNPMTMAGTFGCVVRHKTTGELYILSNCHVLANEGQLAPGAPIFQAGLLDLPAGALKRQIGTLVDFKPYSLVPLKIDAAVAKPLLPSLLSPELLYPRVRPQGAGPAALDMVVQKFGRTTGYTAGRITSIATDATVTYESGSFTFVDQIMIEGLNGSTFSAAGDSGSIILERQSNLGVGLLFAGSPTHTLANHLTEVLDAFDVMIPSSWPS